MKNLKQTICGGIALVSLFLLIVLTVHYVEADRHGQALLTATGGYLAVVIAAKIGGLYYHPEKKKRPARRQPCKAAKQNIPPKV